MAQRLLCYLILGSKVPKYNSPNTHVTYKSMHTNIPIKEIQIPINFGHIAGKLWGDDKQRPILALHGWQDNAGTWDTLVPLILKKRSILAIDFPGHGLSSWIPPGMVYHAWDLPRYILYIKNHFKWDKVSLLCHSMSAIGGLRFSCVFPDDVDFYIAIDCFIQDDFDKKLDMDRYATILKKVLKAQNRLKGEPPAYTQEEIKKIWHEGGSKSVSLENIKYLAKRGTKQSSHDPNKYYFSRDQRLKFLVFYPDAKNFLKALICRLKCPTLYIKAKNTTYSTDEVSVKLRDLIKKNKKKFEMHTVPGTHHLHINTPEKIAPLINNFLKKYKINI